VFQILGNDKPVDEITEEDCERVRDLIARLPPNFKKIPDADKHTIDELAALAERKGMAKLSPTGVNNYLRWFRRSSAGAIARVKWIECQQPMLRST
jgi:hypothetical protein